MKKSVLIVAILATFVGVCAAPQGSGLTAYSLLTHDGRRLVSHQEGTNTVFSLVPTNALPAGLPPIREWTLYAVKATHTDIGLHNSQYIQRHGSVVRLDEARHLIANDPGDSDPGAFRYIVEGAWFWGNYPLDKGAEATRQMVADELRRGRLDVGVSCAGNHTQVYGFEELFRSAYTKRELETNWGIKTRTMLMTDNPGISWSLVAPYAAAGFENILFSPNQWNPHPSTIWTRDDAIPGATWNPDAGGGGNHVDVRWESVIPMVFWWEAPNAESRLLVCTSTHYDFGAAAFGLRTTCSKEEIPSLETIEPILARQLKRMEGRYPYDVWLYSDYGDDEIPTTKQSDLFKEWNKKWKWPQLRTCGKLDEPFDRLRATWGDKIPVLRGEMTSGWLQHAASTPELLARKFAADRALPLAESVASVATAQNGAAYPAAALDHAWKALIWNDEHSYGTSGYQGRRVFETWMQHRDWIERAQRVSSNLLAQAACPAAPTERLVLCKNGVTENEWYRLVVTNGVVYSLYDKELGRELLAAPANEFRYTRDNHKTWEKNPDAALGAEVTRSVWLAEDEKKVVLETDFSHARDLFNTNRYDRFGYMAFPFAVPSFRFAAQLNGPVINPLRDQSGLTTDSYVAVRDWCAVENDDFGIALVQADSCLTEFGQIHPDKTSFGGTVDSSGIFSYLFTDWLQMQNPDGDSFNPRFRYAITSYKGNWQAAQMPRFAERALAVLDKLPTVDAALSQVIKVDAPNIRLLTVKAAEDGKGWVVRFRETTGYPTRAVVRQSLVKNAKATLCTPTERDLSAAESVGADSFALTFAPFGFATVRLDNGTEIPTVADTDDAPYAYSGLIARPRAGQGEKDGQLYVLWGVNAAPDFDHDELYRAEVPDFVCDATTFVASVTNEAPQGIPYRIMRYEDLGLKTHTRYWYKIVPVYKDGRRGAATAAFSGLTREMLGEKVYALERTEGNKCRVEPRGGIITSWCAANSSEELLFLPKRTNWGAEEVHGGIPICWPWFGKPPREGLPKHGLARYATWKLEAFPSDGIIRGTLESSPETKALWPYDFRLDYEVRLTAEALILTLTETNTGTNAFEAAGGFHPYFRVTDPLRVAVNGKPITTEYYRVSSPAVSPTRQLKDLVSGLTITLDATGNDAWYDWNPGRRNTPLCKTLDADEWKGFFCVEPYDATPHRLAPGESKTRTLTLKATK